MVEFVGQSDGALMIVNQSSLPPDEFTLCAIPRTHKKHNQVKIDPQCTRTYQVWFFKPLIKQEIFMWSII